MSSRKSFTEAPTHEIYFEEDNQLAIIHFKRNIEDDDEFASFLCDCDSLYETKSKFVLYIDPSNLTYVSPTYIYGIATYMKENEKNTKKYVSSLGIMVRSSIVRGIIEAIKKIKTPTIPWNLISSDETYKNWKQSLYDDAVMFPVSDM